MLKSKGLLDIDKTKLLEDLGVELEFKNTSGVVGVGRDNVNDFWVAELTIDKKTLKLGKRRSKIEAIKLRRDAEIKYFGKSDINLNDYMEDID